MIIIEMARRRQARRRRAIVMTMMGAVLLLGSGLVTYKAAWVAPQHAKVTQSRLVAATTPACLTTSPAPAVPLKSVPIISVPAHGSPFDVQTTPDGQWSFASVIGPTSSWVAVFSDRSGRPRLVRSIKLPADTFGEALTKNGRYLLVAMASGLAVIDVARAESGAPDAFVELLIDGAPGTNAWFAAVSPDGRYAFVTYPGLGVGVFDLAKALAHGFNVSDTLGIEPIPGAEDVAVSPDGHWLYVTSYPGSLVLVNLRHPESLAAGGRDGLFGWAPPFAIGPTITAGCYPNAVVTSSDGHLVWVTAAYSDELLGFSAARLVSDPAHALVATVRVGVAPDGVALFDRDQRIAVADADWGPLGTGTRPSRRGAAGNVVVVDTAAALAGRPALLGRVRSGLLPSAIAMEANGTTLLVANARSHQLEAVDFTSLLAAR
jgi:DNA-binding beta-propeller fold protein YncE